MKYLKPELLSAEVALAAIHGGKDINLVPDSDPTQVFSDGAAYEVDE